MLVMDSLEPLTRLLSISVSATAFLLPLVPILRPSCHLDFITPYHTISLFLFLVPLYHSPISLPLCYWFTFCSLVTSVT